MTTVTGRVAWAPANDLDLAVSGGARSFFTDGDPEASLSGTSTAESTSTARTDVLGNWSGRYRYGKGVIGVRGMLERGAGGQRQGSDVYGERYWLGGRWTTSLRVSLFDWNDELRPGRDATSFAYVLGGGFRPSRTVQALLEWEHDTNRLVGQRYRLLAVVNLTVTK
jgi:hypothetical protein